MHRQEAIPTWLPHYVARNRGEAKTAKTNSQAGWNPGRAFRKRGITQASRAWLVCSTRRDA